MDLILYFILIYEFLELLGVFLVKRLRLTFSDFKSFTCYKNPIALIICIIFSQYFGHMYNDNVICNESILLLIVQYSIKYN